MRLRLDRVSWPMSRDDVGIVWLYLMFDDGSEDEIHGIRFNEGPARHGTWGWNGSKTNMTLTGAPLGSDSFKSMGRGTVHLYVREGRIEPLDGLQLVDGWDGKLA